MDSRHKKILQSSRSMLVRELDPSQLYDGLISRGIFSQDMIDEIKVDSHIWSVYGPDSILHCGFMASYTILL